MNHSREVRCLGTAVVDKRCSNDSNGSKTVTEFLASPFLPTPTPCPYCLQCRPLLTSVPSSSEIDIVAGDNPARSLQQRGSSKSLKMIATNAYCYWPRGHFYKCFAACSLLRRCQCPAWCALSSDASSAASTSANDSTRPPRAAAKRSASCALAKAGRLPARMGPSADEPCT